MTSFIPFRSVCNSAYVIARKWRINSNYHLEFQNLNNQKVVSKDKVYWIEQNQNIIYIIDKQENKFLLSGPSIDVKSEKAITTIINSK